MHARSPKKFGMTSLKSMTYGWCKNLPKWKLINISANIHAPRRRKQQQKVSSGPIHAQHTSFTYTTYKHAYACPSNFPHLLDSLPRRDRDGRESVWEEKRWGREEESIYGEPPGSQQLSINQNRFNYKKWRKEWAKWDGREEEHELGGGGRRANG